MVGVLPLDMRYTSCNHVWYVSIALEAAARMDTIVTSNGMFVQDFMSNATMIQMTNANGV